MADPETVDRVAGRGRRRSVAVDGDSVVGSVALVPLRAGRATSPSSVSSSIPTAAAGDRPGTRPPRGPGGARPRTDEDRRRGRRRPGADDRHLPRARLPSRGAARGPHPRPIRRAARPDDPGALLEESLPVDGGNGHRRTPADRPRLTKRGDDLRVADVVREHADRRGDHVAHPLRRARRSATRSSTSARAVSRRALLELGVRHGLTRRVPRPHRAGARRAVLRHEQDRRRHGPAQLATRASRARSRRRRRRGRRVLDCGREVRRARRGARREASRRPELVIVEAEALTTRRSLAAHDAVDPGGRGGRDDVVLQMYTSGTTGVPKGVLTTHRNLAAAPRRRRTGTSTGTR